MLVCELENKIVTLKPRLYPLVHLNTMVVIKHECYIDV